ncbi:MAG: hypothetical protein INH41_15960, partial [Myxococcaceae bacterium]|nr:hypothetical protein [Myxococcaceae bacterium]
MRTLFAALALSVSSVALAAPEPVFDRFAAWGQRYREADGDGARLALEKEGVALARARREALAGLARTDPQRALTHFEPRVGLPPAVAALLELPVDTLGRYEVLCPFGRATYAQAVIGQRRFDVTPWGELRKLKTREALRLRGFSIDDVLALADDVAQRSGAPDAEASPFTVGNKRLLYIRIDFSDDPGEPISVTNAQTAITELDRYYRAASFNQTSFVGTVTPTVLRLPRTKASYGQTNATSQLLADARAAAASAGFPQSSYDFEVVAFRRVAAWSWAGLGFVGARGTWLNGSFGLGVIAHELGHNFGLRHANFWQAPNETIIGAGSSQEYGNPFDTMGSGDI